MAWLQGNGASRTRNNATLLNRGFTVRNTLTGYGSACPPSLCCHLFSPRQFHRRSTLPRRAKPPTIPIGPGRTVAPSQDESSRLFRAANAKVKVIASRSVRTMSSSSRALPTKILPHLASSVGSRAAPMDARPRTRRTPMRVRPAGSASLRVPKTRSLCGRSDLEMLGQQQPVATWCAHAAA